MNKNYFKCLSMLHVSEGGYCNRPSDPGGMTKMGITKRAWAKYVGHPVSENDIRSLTRPQAADFYKSEYWDAVKGDELTSGIDYCVFDAAVNSGCTQAAKWLQRAIGCDDDGIIGSKTMASLSHAHVADTIEYICSQRLSMMKALNNWEENKNGWESRVDRVKKESIRMSK